jgi:hypothetical protein
MQQDGTAGPWVHLLRNKPDQSDGGSGVICRTLPGRQPDSGLSDAVARVPPRWEVRAGFPLHFPLSVTAESAGTCRQPPLVAAVRAISPGDFRSLARKKWEVRKNIPHRIWLRVGPQGFGDARGKRLLILQELDVRNPSENPGINEKSILCLRQLFGRISSSGVRFTRSKRSQGK